MKGQLAALRAELTDSYFGGSRPSALDVYVATFLTPLTVLDDKVCPQMIEPLRHAFAAARELFAAHVPDALWALRHVGKSNQRSGQEARPGGAACREIEPEIRSRGPARGRASGGW